jgi:hypothetical protein
MNLPTWPTQAPIRGWPGGVDRRQGRQALWSQGLPGDVGNVAREVAKLLVGIQQARLFRTLVAITH